MGDFGNFNSNYAGNFAQNPTIVDAQATYVRFSVDWIPHNLFNNIVKLFTSFIIAFPIEIVTPSVWSPSNFSHCLNPKV